MLREQVAVHGDRYTAWTRKARMDATGWSRGGSRSPLHTGQLQHRGGDRGECPNGSAGRRPPSLPFNGHIPYVSHCLSQACGGVAWCWLTALTDFIQVDDTQVRL
ncbi:MAG: hypothetical protein R6U98_32265 [Pirellulaceae bacterium]